MIRLISSDSSIGFGRTNIRRLTRNRFLSRGFWDGSLRVTESKDAMHRERGNHPSLAHVWPQAHKTTRHGIKARQRTQGWWAGQVS